ncbi:hypothetical protein ACWGTI_31820 [Mesorhizobium sp. ArgA1]
MAAKFFGLPTMGGPAAPAKSKIRPGLRGLRFIDLAASVDVACGCNLERVRV